MEICTSEILSRGAGIGSPELLLRSGSKRVAFPVISIHTIRTLSKSVGFTTSLLK